jgi:alkylation response protein AidB-like acyl-CoA dehydrogenase
MAPRRLTETKDLTDRFSCGSAKLYEIGAGTSEIRRMLIGRQIFEKTS